MLYILGYLTSACAKRDAVGRKPKRAVFAKEGLKVCEEEMEKEIQCMLFSGVYPGDTDIYPLKCRCGLG